MNLVQKEALSFDDILLIPKHSEITSRNSPEISLETYLTRNIKLQNPIVSTNMSTVTEDDMLVAMNLNGSIGFLHRFHSLSLQKEIINKAIDKGMTSYVLSIGVKSEDYINLDEIAKLNPSAILIDIAHGDSKLVIDLLTHIKSNYPFDVIAGNVATADGYSRLVQAGADAVRVGIGGGNACTTRVVTGFGVPTLQSIIDCARVYFNNLQFGVRVPIIADGGIRGSNDAVKAIAAGASTVCIGSLLASTSHSPGQILERVYRGDVTYGYRPVSIEYAETLASEEYNNLFKEYYGMSSAKAQDTFKGGVSKGITPEGLHKHLPYKGNTQDVLEKLTGGIRSGFTYNGTYTIEELQRTSSYMTLSPGAIRESKH